MHQGTCSFVIDVSKYTDLASYKRILTTQDDITTRTIVQIYVSSTRYMIINKTVETNSYVEGQYF